MRDLGEFACGMERMAFNVLFASPLGPNEFKEGIPRDKIPRPS